MTREILECALKSCEAAEVFSVKKTSTPVEFEANRLQKLETSEQSGTALRIVRRGRVGFSSTTRADNIHALIDRACATAEFGAPATFQFPNGSQFEEVHNYDPRVPEIPVEAIVETGEALVESLRKLHPKLQATVSLQKAVLDVAIVNSSGLSASHRSSQYNGLVIIKVIDGENFLQFYELLGGTSADLDVGPTQQRIAQKVRDGARNATLPSGEYPVLMSPLAMNDLAQPVLACVNGGAVDKGFSPWKDQLGQQVADSRLCLYDDQIRAGSVASAPFDDEGSPKQRLPIIEHGVLRSLTLDLGTAAALGRAPTGNGHRPSVDVTPGIAMSTLVIEPGEIALKDLAGGMRRGVIVDLMMGAFAGNALGGAINANIVLGYVVENGEIVGRLKDAMLSANVFEALSKRVIGVSREQIDYGKSVLPYVLLDGISIVTRC